MAKYYSMVPLENEDYLLPGWEVISRDPNTRTIVVDGTIISTNSSQRRMLLELPQKLIRYPTTKEELKQRICSADYHEKIIINNKPVTTEKAVNIITKAKSDFIVMQEEYPYTAVSFGFNESITIIID